MAKNLDAAFVDARYYVNKDFDDCKVLLAGSPASVIRRNVGWKRPLLG